MLNLKAWMQKISEWLYTPSVSRASGTDAFYRANCSDTGVSVSFGVGLGGVNHGIWSSKLGKWLIYGDASNVYVNGVQIPEGLQPQYQQVTLPYTPTKNGILLLGLRAQVAGRVYITLSTGAPGISDGYQVSGGYVMSAHFCYGGTAITATSSSNLYDYVAYYVSWG